jgi:cytochrome c oxidase subunit 2
MERTRSALVLGFCVGLLLVATEPVAAYDSINEQLIGDLNNVLLYAAIPITVLVQAILLYSILKFRNNDDPKPTQENRRLEITWTVATAIVLLFVGLASFQVMADPFVTHQQDDEPGEDDVEIEVVAFNYGWDFVYEDEGFETTEEAVIPTDTEVYFNVTAPGDSYIHGFHVPDLHLKQDANPGQHHTVKTEVYNEGEYQGYCSKYCGVGHSNMYFTITAVDDDEYEQWVQEQQAENGEEEEEEVEEEDAEAEETADEDEADEEGEAGEEAEDPADEEEDAEDEQS